MYLMHYGIKGMKWGDGRIRTGDLILTKDRNVTAQGLIHGTARKRPRSVHTPKFLPVEQSEKVLSAEKKSQ